MAEEDESTKDEAATEPLSYARAAVRRQTSRVPDDYVARGTVAIWISILAGVVLAIGYLVTFTIAEGHASIPSTMLIVLVFPVVSFLSIVAATGASMVRRKPKRDMLPRFWVITLCEWVIALIYLTMPQ